MLVTLREMGEVSFHLVGTSAFHVKAEKEGYRCRQKLKFEHFTPSFCRLSSKSPHNRRYWGVHCSETRKLIPITPVVKVNVKKRAYACHSCNTSIFHYPTNHVIHLWRCRYPCCRRFFNSLLSCLELIGGKTVLPILDNRRSKCQVSRHAITKMSNIKLINT